MEENTPAVDTAQEAAAETAPDAAPQIDQEAITNSIIEKVKGFFKKDEPQAKEQAPAEQQPVDIDAIVAQRVREEVDKIAAKTKEKAKQSLEEREAELIAKEKDIKLKEQFLEIGVPTQFQDFIRHEVESKGIELQEFLAANPQYVQQQVSTQVATNMKTTMSQKQIDYLEFLAKNKSYK